MHVSSDSDIQILFSYAKQLIEGKNPRLKVEVTKSGSKSLTYAARISIFSEDKVGVVERILEVCAQHLNKFKSHEALSNKESKLGLLSQSIHLIQSLRTIYQAGYDKIESSLFQLEGAYRELRGKIETPWPLVDPFFRNRDIRFYDQIFSQQRIDAIVDRLQAQGIKLPILAKRENGVSLTDNEVSLLLLGIADVRLQDVNCLFNTIKTQPSTLGHLNEENTAKLVARFSTINTFSEMTRAHFNDLMDILCPFGIIDEIFSGEHVVVSDKADDSGKTLIGIKERIRICQAFRMNNGAEFGSGTPEIISKWNYILLKRLVDREPPEGCIIPHPNGYYVLHRNIRGGGAYKLLLKALTVDPNFESCILYRGTRGNSKATDSALTIKEDMRNNIGSLGPRETYHETKNYLTQPNFAFATRPDEKFKLIGFSLGAVHAMRDCCLFKEQISEVWTLCSPGLDKPTLKWFQALSQNFKHTLKVTHVIEFDDLVHKLGQGLLGLKCNPEKVEVNIVGLMPEETGEGIKIHTGEWIHNVYSSSMIIRAFGVIKSLGYAHIRNTLRHSNYGVYAVSNKVNVELANKIMDNKSDKNAYAFDKQRRRVALEGKYTFVEFLDKVSHSSSSR